MNSLFFNLSALLALVPASLAPLRSGPARDGLFWSVLLLAVAGPAIWAAVQVAEAWRTGLSVTLWVTIAVSMAIFAGLAAIDRHAWRLTPLLLPYLIALGLLATIWSNVPGHRLEGTAPSAWIDIHIVVSVVTYALLTIAAVAALAAFLQERALKNKRPSELTRMLPAVAESERLLAHLLIASEIVLGLGLVSGMATSWFEQGRLVPFDHKTMLSILSFGVIGALLVARWRTGVRGRMAARLVLLAWLLLTLAYPGVKFVTDVLMA